MNRQASNPVALLLRLLADAGYEIHRSDGVPLAPVDLEAIDALIAGALANDNGPPAALPAND